jgi:hypothetical protein
MFWTVNHSCLAVSAVRTCAAVLTLNNSKLLSDEDEVTRAATQLLVQRCLVSARFQRAQYLPVCTLVSWQ